ncbi:phosphoribosylanthranilate isomerase [Neobacillus niacini]|uniref:phosphoribosylanthranilate isomerase n=1 Tax=Neobacillus niacini TaxID=86668 RepID=UPI0028559AA7|nr:phosphoribosylanthranilate isomerase [Neobacillus niacini]MDR6998251.1 phosphoribosylanthranilate isomerase [Neobacillus niacini]
MKVKICGITDADTALAAVNYGADAIGFVFAESKRKVELEKAKEIIAKLPSEVLKVGVFVNETVEEIEKIANYTGLTHIQLHGDEAASISEKLTLPVIKAASIESNDTLEEIKNYPCEYLLLDGPKGKYRGGNGTAFNWKNINLDRLKEKKIILAGGLNPDNVEEAIQTIQPEMVDVSSGVETDGKKDLQKIKKFIEKAKGSLTRRISI